MPPATSASTSPGSARSASAPVDLGLEQEQPDQGLQRRAAASYAGARGSSRCARARAGPSYRAGRRRRRRCTAPRPARRAAPARERRRVRRRRARRHAAIVAPAAGDAAPSRADAASIGAWLVLVRVLAAVAVLVASRRRPRARARRRSAATSRAAAATPRPSRGSCVRRSPSPRAPPTRGAAPSRGTPRGSAATASWTVLAHDSWRAGSGLPGGSTDERLREGPRLAAERARTRCCSTTTTTAT